MPVTFYPSPDTAIESGNPAFIRSSPASMAESALERTGSNKMVDTHLQSSFGRNRNQDVAVLPQRNGFVDTVYAAYNRHHALIIRPDDVWICILTQFNLFVNGQGRAEQLRYLFVAHEGKKKLVVDLLKVGGDYGRVAQVMTEMLHENVVDPELREWCLPDFSTTKDNDKVVASVVMMATLKAYFSYVLSSCCGIPRVTLLGTQQDWLSIYHRVEKLDQYGAETAAWRDLLRPVLARFARAFEPGYADSAENRDFWQRVVHPNNDMSGPTLLGGWITAFCGFDDEGRWMGAKQDLEAAAPAQTTPITVGPDENALSFQYPFGKVETVTDSGDFEDSGPEYLTMDGVAYHHVSADSTPVGVAEVEVEIVEDELSIPAMMLAGLAGSAFHDCHPSGDAGELDCVALGAIRPVAAWWMFTTSPAPVKPEHDLAAYVRGLLAEL